MKYAEHLGDGAYIHFRDGEVVLTANHHDPAQASDVVVLDGHAVTRLQAWLERTHAALSKIAALHAAVAKIDEMTSPTEIDAENRQAGVEELELLEADSRRH